MNEVIIIVAKYFVFIPILLLPIVFIQLKSKGEKRSFVIALIAGGLLSLLFAYIASSLFYNARPFVVGHFTPLISHTNSNGFPSDHTLLAAFIGWTLLLHYSRKYGVFVLIIALMVGSARVLAGVHHSIDIAGSVVITLLAASLVRFILIKFDFTKKVAIDTNNEDS